MNVPKEGDKYEERGIRITIGRIVNREWYWIHCVIPGNPDENPMMPRYYEHPWDKEQYFPDGKVPDDWRKVDEWTPVVGHDPPLWKV